MSKNSENIRKLKAKNKQLREQNAKIKKENSLLVSKNEILEQEKQKISQQFNAYCNADKNQLTAKESFIVSMPILVVLISASIAIAYISYKDNTNKLGYILAVFSFIISILSFIFDIAQIFLNKLNFKNETLISLSRFIRHEILVYLTITFGALSLTVLYFICNSIPDTSHSNFICSFTLIIYFSDILISKILWKL